MDIAGESGGNCDLCDAGEATEPTDVPFPVGSRVRHPKWGEATVQRYEQACPDVELTIHFANFLDPLGGLRGGAADGEQGENNDVHHDSLHVLHRHTLALRPNR